jgi:hypothetical protein
VALPSFRLPSGFLTKSLYALFLSPSWSLWLKQIKIIKSAQFAGNLVEIMELDVFICVRF